MAETKLGQHKKDKSEWLAKMKATDKQWYLIDVAIKAFITRYPTQWADFQRQLKMERTEFNLAAKEHKDLRSANFRNTASFPVIFDAEGKEIDSLLPVLKKIIPRLTHKKSVNYVTFLKKYPMFLPGEKY